MAARFYKQVKIMGFILFIPLILATAPLAGYFAAVFLQEKFRLAAYVPSLGAGLGLILAGRETVRIIRLITKIDKEP